MFERKVIEYIETHQLIPEGSHILVGVSGGPDSLVLLHLLKSWQELFKCQIVCAHVDHMFRGKESYDDYLFVEKTCKEWDIPFEGKQIDVAAYMNDSGESTQLAARNLRYAFFQEVMEKHHLDVLVLGHHGDDQVETMLMRLTRGSAEKARAGIPVKRPFASGCLARPLLCAARSEIESYVKQHELDPRMDPSNEKNDYLRNRFRHVVLPFLKKENPNVHEHFQRFSEELTDDEVYLQSLAAKELNGIWLERKMDGSVIDLVRLLMVPKPLQRRMIHLILNYLYIKRPSSLSAVHIDQLLTLFTNPHPSAELHLPDGLIVEKSYQKGIFRFFTNESPEYSIKLDVPGETILPNGYIIKAHYIKDEMSVLNGNHTFLLSASSVSLPLTARTRINGDRMTVKGLGGTKKLKGIFIDKKIPRQERTTWPVVVDQAGEIVWLPGLKKSVRESEHTQNETSFIYLEYKKA